ncbi:MAG: ComF family protein [Desulfobacterales bacterium]
MFGTLDDEDHLCGGCMQDPKHFRIARAIGVYDRTCMELIHAFKYRQKIQLARPFGMLLFAAFIRHWSDSDIDLIVPVPLHRKRFRKRGFNQTYLIIRALPGLVDRAIAGGATLRPIQIDRECLVRNRLTDPQIGLKRDQRISNVKDVFDVSDPSRIAGKGILLIDDVYTTGATVDACTRVLLKEGARCVDVLTLARAM